MRILVPDSPAIVRGVSWPVSVASLRGEANAVDQIFGNLQLLFEFPAVNLEIIIQGAMIGAIFVLVAYGLALVWGVMNVKNLAQGALVIAGGYVSWWLAQRGMPVLVGIPVAAIVLALIGGACSGTPIDKFCRRHWRVAIVFAVAMTVVMFAGLYTTAPGSAWAAYEGVGRTFGTIGGIGLFGILVACGGLYGLVISRVIERDLFTSLLATFGIGIMFEQLMNLMFGSDTQSLRLDYDSFSFFGGIVNVPVAKLLAVIMAAALAIAVIIFMKRSRMGQAIRATAQDARAARVLGIDTERVYAFTFSLNAALCGAAGALVVLVWEIMPFYGIPYSVRAFVIVTAAGLGNLPGVIAAGIGIGVMEQYGGHIFGIGYQQAIAVLLLLLVLLIRLAQQRRNRQVLQ